MRRTPRCGASFIDRLVHHLTGVGLDELVRNGLHVIPGGGDLLFSKGNFPLLLEATGKAVVACHHS